MHFYIMTLFPEMVMDGLKTSIIGRAIKNGLLSSIEAVNIRDYAFNKHNSVDDYPYGGGAGMLMQAEPVYQCYRALEDRIGKQSAGGLSFTAGTDISPGNGRRICERRRAGIACAGIMKASTSACWKRS